METIIRRIVKENLNCTVLKAELIGKGASGSVYKVITDKEPYKIALKISCHPEMLREEYEKIKFISDRVDDCKLPKPYFLCVETDKAYFGMELIEGVEASKKALMFKPNKKKLANEIVDNLIKIHSVHNDKFGPINNAVYDTWFDYYSEFAKEIYDFISDKNTKSPDVVKKAVFAAYDNLDKILDACKNTPTLIHGDYWLPNFIVDTKTMSLKGVIDPFNVMWTEPEYELFTLTSGYGNNLHLYDIYKCKVETSDYCDLKVEMYALFNELLWYKKMGKIDFGYLEYRSGRLLEYLKNI